MTIPMIRMQKAIIGVIALCFIAVSGLTASEVKRSGKGSKPTSSALVEALKSKVSYPALANRYGFEGSVIAEIDIDENGTIFMVNILEPARFALFNSQLRSDLTGKKINPEVMEGEAFPKRVALRFTFERSKDNTTPYDIK